MSLPARLSVRAVLALHALFASGVATLLTIVLLVPGLRSATVGQRAEDAALLAESLASIVMVRCAGVSDPPACERDALAGLPAGARAQVGEPGPTPPGHVRGTAQLQGGPAPRWLSVDLPLAPAHLRAARTAELATGLAALEALALFLLFYAVLVRLVARPADRLIASLERAGSGELATGAEPGMGQIGAALDRMERRLDGERRRVAEQVEELRQVNRQLSEARDAVVRQEKLATVGRLSAGVAHEVGNPLSAILGYLEVLRVKAAKDAAIVEYVDRLERETRRIDRIVRDLLDFARPTRGAADAAVSISGVVLRTVRLVETQKRFAHVTIAVAPMPDLPPARADEHYLQQVLLNLLVNAADAMGGRGTIRVDAELAAPAHPGRRAGDTPPVPRVAITVRDEGPGIPVQDLPRIFDPFFTTKQPGEGTGLGLSICHSLVESFGGTISAANGEGGGAVFRVEIPAAQVEAPASSARVGS